MALNVGELVATRRADTRDFKGGMELVREEAGKVGREMKGRLWEWERSLRRCSAFSSERAYEVREAESRSTPYGFWGWCRRLPPGRYC